MPTPATIFVLIGVFVAVAPAIGASGIQPLSTQPVVIPVSAEAGLRQIVATRPSARAVRQIVTAQAAVKASRPDTTPVAYTVQAGDTLWTIAQRHGVTVEALAAANSLTLTAILPLEKSLKVPSGIAPVPASRPAARTPTRTEKSAVHVVRSGETLWEIAGRYGARVEDLMAMNDLGHSDWIKPGQRILVSAGALPRHRQVALQSRTRSGSSGPVMADASALRSGGAFIWPARGTLTSRFGWRYRRHHEGIDLAAPRGTPIYAARDGVVEYSGWKGGYGRALFVRHGGGVVTVYGHASSLFAKTGQAVKKGELIARVGCTGRCTGSHLHFEVRVGGRAVNPLNYLR